MISALGMETPFSAQSGTVDDIPKFDLSLKQRESDPPMDIGLVEPFDNTRIKT